MDFQEFLKNSANVTDSILATGVNAANAVTRFSSEALGNINNFIDPNVEAVANFLNPDEAKRVSDVAQPPSIGPRSLNVGGLDPIQGYDVGVWVQDKGRQHAPALLGQFTSILVTVRNASEAYLPVGSRQPVYFDGEIQIAFSLEKGLLDSNVFEETFGFRSLDFNNKYYRSPRFKITFAIDPVDWTQLNQPTKLLDSNLYPTPSEPQRWSSGRLTLDFCKIDTWHLGAKSGKEVVATQWSGVAQQIYSNANIYQDLNSKGISSETYYNSETGQPKDLSKVYTFNYDVAQAATTKPPPFAKSYNDGGSGDNQKQILQMTLGVYEGIANSAPAGPLKDTAQALVNSTKRQLAAISGGIAKEGKSTNDGKYKDAVDTFNNKSTSDGLDPVASLELLLASAKQNLLILEQTMSQFPRAQDREANQAAVYGMGQLVENLTNKIASIRQEIPKYPENKSTADREVEHFAALIKLFTEQRTEAIIKGNTQAQKTAEDDLLNVIKAIQPKLSEFDSKSTGPAGTVPTKDTFKNKSDVTEKNVNRALDLINKRQALLSDPIKNKDEIEKIDKQLRTKFGPKSSSNSETYISSKLDLVKQRQELLSKPDKTIEELEKLEKINKELTLIKSAGPESTNPVTDIFSDKSSSNSETYINAKLDLVKQRQELLNKPDKTTKELEKLEKINKELTIIKSTGPESTNPAANVFSDKSKNLTPNPNAKDIFEDKDKSK